MCREIVIKPVLNGYFCQVGCQYVVFSSRQELVRELDAYYADPEGTEKRFVERAVNKTLSPAPEVADCRENTTRDCVMQAPQGLVGGLR